MLLYVSLGKSTIADFLSSSAINRNIMFDILIAEIESSPQSS